MESSRQSHQGSTVGYFDRITMLIFRSGGIVFGADAGEVIEILDDENVNYSDKNRAEELLALANFSKDN